MADDADFAAEHEQKERDYLLNKALVKKTTLPATGSCHFCNEKVDGGKLFCDSDCRDLFQREADSRRRAGKYSSA